MQDSSWSSTPTKSNVHREPGRDFSSPTGFPVIHGLPDDFKSTKTHLDSREVYGKTMLRRIAPTSWSTKYQLAGKEMDSIRLVDLLWRGWNNYHLRALSHGQYVSLVVARKVNERVFSSSILTHLRENKWDIDELSTQFARLHPEACPNASSNSDEHKAIKAQALAKFLVQQLQQFVVSSNSQPSDLQKIAQLEEQLQMEKAKNAKRGLEEPEPSPSEKRVRLKQKTALPIVSSSAPQFDPAVIARQAVDPSNIPKDRVFAQASLSSVTKTAIEKWLKSLKGKDKGKAEQLDAAISFADKISNTIDAATFQALRDKCAQLGLPVSLAVKIKAPELIRILTAATFVAEI